MGVHGLWELLAPVGHRVSNESVRNKVLAVDVSIWLTQFVKAMRDAEGAQVRNGHLLGVFRRCIKLLYLSVKPVLIFDGATPALKRRTLSSRRAQREKHAAKLRRLAEKMLLNRIKQRSIDHAIAKKRKGKPQKTSTHRKKDTLTSSIHSKYHDSENVDTNDHPDRFSDALLAPSRRSYENPKIAVDKSSGVLDDTFFSDDEYEVTDIDEMQISLPQNVDRLDDEVLTKLPPKLQSEVFKQAKLAQRARHRENMLQEQQRPSEFSRMQIDGFLRHTALNRKISRVRSVLNAKSGASRRIASDCKRGFVLMQDTLTETRTERGQSEEEWEDADQKIGCPAQSDLLANIRTKKEAFKYAPSVTNEERRPLDMRTHVESGNEWASKVLEGNGSLYTSPKALDITNVENGDQPWFRAKTEFHQSCKEPQHEGINLMKNTQANAGQNEMINYTDDSDDEEWEDGSKPASHDLKEFGGVHVKENVASEGLCMRSASDKHVELTVFGTSSRHGRPHHKGSCTLIKEHVAANEVDQLTTTRSNSTPDILHHNITQTADNSAFMPRSPIGENICEGNRSLHDGGSTPLQQKPSRKTTVKNHVRVTKINSKEGDSSLSLFSDEIRPENEQKPPTRQTTESQQDNPSRTREKLIEQKTCLTHDRTSSHDKKDHLKSILKHENSFTKNAMSFKSGEHVIPFESTEGNDRTKERNRVVQSNELIANDELQATESKVSWNPLEESYSTEAIAKGIQPSSFSPVNNRETESFEEPTRNIAKTSGSPIAGECLDRANEERIREASDESEKKEPSVAQLESIQKQLEAEAREIDQQRSTYRGGADTVADEMYSETRDLIKLLGIPYLEAPMEAEAQCAFLNKEKIVHGVLTEDSDTFLFGAITVYRHLFAEGRFAEAYEAKDIQQCLGLDQEKLIRLAYLLGSDYTSGVRGVGIVNSMEILEAFPGPTGLTEFRDWMLSVTLLDEEPKKEMLRNHDMEAVRKRFCWKHRNMKRNWEVREGFPNPAVFDAYKDPVVDKCKEKFSWGPIDFEGLARFCWDKFGWDSFKFEGAVGPLRQKLQEVSGSGQRRIDEFFRPHRFAKIRSERLQSAVQGIAGGLSTDLVATKVRAQKRTKPTTKSITTRGCVHDEAESDQV